MAEKDKNTAAEQETSETTPKKKDDPIAIAGTDITESKLKELKGKYKKIFVTDYIGETYVWHRIGRKAFSSICDATESIEDEDQLINEREKRFCKECIIYPSTEKVADDVEDDVAASKLSREILYRSGFFPPETKEV